MLRVASVLTVTFACLSVMAPQSAFAGAPGITAPTRVYPTENMTMGFSGTDPVSSQSRVISVSGLIGDCAASAADAYNTSNCPGLALALSSTAAGLIDIPGVAHHKDSANRDHLVAPSGAVIVYSTDPDGKASAAYNIYGTQAQLKSTLSTLEFVSATGYRENALAQDDDQLPYLSMEATDGDGASSASAVTTIKVEGPNGEPAIVVPQSPLTAVTGQTADFIDDADVTDPEMCTASLCGAPYGNTPIADPDASMLLVAWLDQNCGRFNFGDAEFSSHGSADNSDVDSLLLNAQLRENAENGYNSDQRAAITSTLDPEALALDLSEEVGEASQDTSLFAGIGDLENVDYALSHIEYTPPANPGTCHLNVAVSDLGNDGTPLSYTDQSIPGYEVPDALADSGQISFDVIGTHPDVTVNQSDPNGPGVDPTHTDANYTITFNQDVSSFDGADLDTSSSTLGLAVACNVITVSPSRVWSASCTSNKDGVIKAKVDAGIVYAQGHDGEQGYSNNASTSTDNSVTWDATSPAVTIDQPSSQPDPTSIAPVDFTAVFSEPVTGFTGSDVDLGGSTAGGPLHAEVSGGPQTYAVAVTGMSRNGQVVATIPSGAAADDASNPSLASTSTDGAVTWHEVVDPTIINHLSSAHPRHEGWFRSAVHIAFTCETGTAPLFGSCPKTVVLTADTRQTAITRTIHATDGGSAMTTAGPVRIDRTKPTLAVKGVTSGKNYRHVPKLRCVAHDALSGVASCKISKHRHGKAVHYVATAMDRAGNKTTKAGHYRLT